MFPTRGPFFNYAHFHFGKECCYTVMTREQYSLLLLHSPVDPVTNSECMSKQQSPPTDTVSEDCELNKHLNRNSTLFCCRERII